MACDWDSELSEELERLDYDVYNALLERAARNGVDSPWEQSKYARRLIDPKKRKLIDEVLDRGVVIELFFYDHSGCAMNTTGFGCRWDSDPVGYIVCDPETIEREFAGDFDRAEKAIQAEVKVYSQWLEGDVWGYVLEDDEGNEIDSCWGFYGSDPKENGIADCVDLDVCEVVYE
ncbi:MAG: hypothetical protein DRH04_03520 [Deltaproteobacteria bacterium]|nr:MAG: hypothetical protein DRH04_03520 [Deltaproteobacteria bacterium]